MIKLPLGLVLVLAIAGPAAAQVKADPAPTRFDAADTNHDGKVDRSEYDGFVQELVLLYDVDRDGKLTRSELASAPDPSKFDKIDANHDGYLVIEEIDAYTDSDFAVMDKNADGAIERDEVAQRK
jgi:Ca2+-binding EF-hand superfamily protein